MRVFVLGVALTGCVAQTSVLGDGCGDGVVLDAPEAIGCVAREIEVDARSACTDAVGGVRGGTWVRVRRREGRPAHARITAIDPEAGCVGAVPPCPFVIAAPSSPVCTCPFINQPLEVPSAGLVMTIEEREQQVLLAGNGQRYLVEVCATDPDSYPLCAVSEVGPTCPDGYSLGAVFESCVCAPPCARDADCPVPRTGSATPQCVSGACLLGCEGDAACPDGQVCVGLGANTCMWPGWPE